MNRLHADGAYKCLLQACRHQLDLGSTMHELRDGKESTDNMQSGPPAAAPEGRLAKANGSVEGKVACAGGHAANGSAVPMAAEVSYCDSIMIQRSQQLLNRIWIYL